MSSNLKDLLDQIEQEALQGKVVQAENKPAPTPVAQSVAQPAPAPEPPPTHDAPAATHPPSTDEEAVPAPVPEPEPAPAPAPVAQPTQKATEQSNTPSTYEEQASYEENNYEHDPTYEQSSQRRRRRKRSVSSKRSEKKESRILIYAALVLCLAILVSGLFVVRAMLDRFDERDKAAKQEAAPRRTTPTAQQQLSTQADNTMQLPSSMLTPEDKSKELFDPSIFGLPDEEVKDDETNNH